MLRSFTALIQDVQFSTLGLTLLAELSKIWSSLASHPIQVNDKISPTTKLAGSNDDIPLTLSEDVGEAVRRNALSTFADIGTNYIPAFDPFMGPGCLTNVEKHLDGRKRAGLRPDARSASIQWQRQRESVNAIDDLFHGLS